MKVYVTYSITIDTEIEVDDRFKALYDEDITRAEEQNLQGDLVAECYERIPLNANLLSIFDTETEEPLYEF